MGRNLPEPRPGQEGYTCIFHHLSPPQRVGAHFFNESAIKCEPTKVKRCVCCNFKLISFWIINLSRHTIKWLISCFALYCIIVVHTCIYQTSQWMVFLRVMFYILIICGMKSFSSLIESLFSKVYYAYWLVHASWPGVSFHFCRTMYIMYIIFPVY